MYFYEGNADYESAYDPMVKLFWREWQAEDRRLTAINQLLDSLTPADVTKPLFTFHERSWYDIPWDHQPRPRE